MGSCTLSDDSLLPKRVTQIKVLVPASRSLAVVKDKLYSEGGGGREGGNGGKEWRGEERGREGEGGHDNGEDKVCWSAGTCTINHVLAEN